MKYLLFKHCCYCLQPFLYNATITDVDIDGRKSVGIS